MSYTIKKYEVPIDAKVLYQMMEYAAWAEHHYNSEIAGFGFYNKDDGIYKLAPLTSQDVSGGHTNAVPDEILANPKIDLTEMVVQWHSHVRMATTPSCEDIKTRETLVKSMGFLISIIINLNGDVSCTILASSVGATQLTSPLEISAMLVPYYTSDKISAEVKKLLTKPEKKYGQSWGGVADEYEASLYGDGLFTPPPTPPAGSKSISTVSKWVDKLTTIPNMQKIYATQISARLRFKNYDIVLWDDGIGCIAEIEHSGKKIIKPFYNLGSLVEWIDKLSLNGRTLTDWRQVLEKRKDLKLVESSNYSAKYSGKHNLVISLWSDYGKCECDVAMDGVPGKNIANLQELIDHLDKLKKVK